MAAPKLKINTPAAGARPKLAVAAAPAARVKLNAGAAPATRPALKGADGKAIAPKPASYLMVDGPKQDLILVR